MITRTGLVDSTEGIVAEIRRENVSAPVFGAASRVSSVAGLGTFLRDKPAPDGDSKHHVAEDGFLFCGLGNPQSLRRQLTNELFQLKGFYDFPDHHVYTQQDVHLIESQAERCGARSLLTTAKDAVKLDGLVLTMPCFVVSSSLR